MIDESRYELQDKSSRGWERRICGGFLECRCATEALSSTGTTVEGLAVL